MLFRQHRNLSPVVIMTDTSDEWIDVERVIFIAPGSRPIDYNYDRRGSSLRSGISPALTRTRTTVAVG